MGTTSVVLDAHQRRFYSQKYDRVSLFLYLLPSNASCCCCHSALTPTRSAGCACTSTTRSSTYSSLTSRPSTTECTRKALQELLVEHAAAERDIEAHEYHAHGHKYVEAAVCEQQLFSALRERDCASNVCVQTLGAEAEREPELERAEVSA